MAQLFNDEAIALSKRHPERFIAMATLPLQDPQRGVPNSNVLALGIKAVEIGASIHERELDDPALEVFWSAAEALGMLVFIHPMRPPGAGAHVALSFVQSDRFSDRDHFGGRAAYLQRRAR